MRLGRRGRSGWRNSTGCAGECGSWRWCPHRVPGSSRNTTRAFPRERLFHFYINRLWISFYIFGYCAVKSSTHEQSETKTLTVSLQWKKWKKNCQSFSLDLIHWGWKQLKCSSRPLEEKNWTGRLKMTKSEPIMNRFHRTNYTWQRKESKKDNHE